MSSKMSERYKDYKQGTWHISRYLGTGERSTIPQILAAAEAVEPPIDETVLSLLPKVIEGRSKMSLQWQLHGPKNSQTFKKNLTHIAFIDGLKKVECILRRKRKYTQNFGSNEKATEVTSNDRLIQSVALSNNGSSGIEGDSDQNRVAEKQQDSSEKSQSRKAKFAGVKSTSAKSNQELRHQTCHTSPIEIYGYYDVSAVNECVRSAKEKWQSQTPSILFEAIAQLQTRLQMIRRYAENEQSASLIAGVTPKELPEILQSGSDRIQSVGDLYTALGIMLMSFRCTVLKHMVKMPAEQLYDRSGADQTSIGSNEKLTSELASWRNALEEQQRKLKFTKKSYRTRTKESGSDSNENLPASLFFKKVLLHHDVVAGFSCLAFEGQERILDPFSEALLDFCITGALPMSLLVLFEVCAELHCDETMGKSKEVFRRLFQSEHSNIASCLPMDQFEYDGYGEAVSRIPEDFLVYFKMTEYLPFLQYTITLRVRIDYHLSKFGPNFSESPVGCMAWIYERGRALGTIQGEWTIMKKAISEHRFSIPDNDTCNNYKMYNAFCLESARTPESRSRPVIDIRTRRATVLTKLRIAEHNASQSQSRSYRTVHGVLMEHSEKQKSSRESQEQAPAKDTVLNAASKVPWKGQKSPRSKRKGSCRKQGEPRMQKGDCQSLLETLDEGLRSTDEWLDTDYIKLREECEALILEVKEAVARWNPSSAASASSHFDVTSLLFRMMADDAECRVMEAVSSAIEARVC